MTSAMPCSSPGCSRPCSSARILLLVTSNYAPEGLLPNPLYHARFKPVIELINARMQVMEVGGPHDYRSQARHLHIRSSPRAITCGRPRQHSARPSICRHRCTAVALTVGTRQFQAPFCEERPRRFYLQRSV